MDTCSNTHTHTKNIQKQCPSNFQLFPTVSNNFHTPTISLNFQQRSSAIRDGPLYTMQRSWTQRRWNSCWSNTSVRSYMMGGWLNNRRWRRIRFVVVVVVVAVVVAVVVVAAVGVGFVVVVVVVVQVDVCFGAKSHIIFVSVYMFVFGIYWILIWWMSCTRQTADLTKQQHPTTNLIASDG